MSWTDERVALLKRLWGEGKTAAEIAKELGGVTRNAVIGKAHRLKLSGRVSPIQQNTKKAAKKTETKKTAKKIQVVKNKPSIPETTVKVDGKRYDLAELKGNMCRWPIGDPRDDDFGFCGDKILTGLPYCAEHGKVAYQAATRNRILKAEKLEQSGSDQKKKGAAAA